MEINNNNKMDFLHFLWPKGPSNFSLMISDDEMSSNNLTAFFFESNTVCADSWRLDWVCFITDETFAWDGVA